MTIARIESDMIAEIIEGKTIEDVPEHKRGALVAVTGDPPDYDASVQSLSGPNYLYEDGAVTRSWTIVTPDLADLRTIWAQRIGKRRKQAETEFVFNQIPIVLDEGTQQRITGAVNYLTLSGAESVQWDVGAQSVTLDLTAMTALWIAAGAHVQACFANQLALKADVAAAQSLDDLKSINLEAGWP